MDQHGHRVVVFSVFDLYRSVPFILATLLVLRFLALMFSFRRTLRLSLANSALWSLLMIATWVSVMLGIGETLLWAAGAIEYECRSPWQFSFLRSCFEQNGSLQFPVS
jgi:hypothetical protein